MATLGLYVFRHDSKLGNAPTHAMFDRYSVARRDGIAVPRAFADYQVRFDGQSLPPGATIQAAPGVTLIRRC